MRLRDLICDAIGAICIMAFPFVTLWMAHGFGL